ncbi:hypothetical protein VPH35_032605 [Triticum aestivum]
MAEASWSNSPPSAKHHRGEASGKEPLVVDDDVPVPEQKQDYTVPLKVDIHLKEPLDVVCTSNVDEGDKMIRKMRRRLGGMLRRNIGVDVEYTREDKPLQIAAVLQLCVEDLVLINPDNYVDLQRKWRVQNNGKKWQSLAKFAGSLIHPSYKEMKQKIDRKSDHLLWGDSPLPNNLIEYAAKDAYVTYEAWKKIEITKQGLELWQEAEDHWDDPYYLGY